MSDSRKIDQSFPTWSFDQACQAMEWNKLVDVNFTVCPHSVDAVQADLVILGITGPKATERDDSSSGKYVLEGVSKTIDDELDGAISDLLEEQLKTFKNGAKVGSFTPAIRVVGRPVKRYILLGLGPSEGEAKDWNVNGMILGKAIVSACANEKKVALVNVVLPYSLVSSKSFVRDLTTSFYEAMYSDNRYRNNDKIKNPIESLTAMTISYENSESALLSVNEDIEIGKKIALGTILARDIVNAPHNVLNSESLAETAKRVAAESNGLVTCSILEKDDCEARGMGSYLGVARGSETRPQFIHMTYRPPSGSIKLRLGVVGKGVCFDTGGYNIKTQLMEYMKFDCGGSAATIGAARSIAALQPLGVEVHFIVAACENMINEKSYKPSDILTAMNGKTIEVMNTDAEGRLTLADALCYADMEVGCDKILELSTLTGTTWAFLGSFWSAFWTDDDELAMQIDKASKKTGEKTWRMPLEKEYANMLDSVSADMKNIGPRWGGPMHAALFLTNFVDSKKPFAHIDLPGPVWDDKTGATGFGAKLVTEWIVQNEQK